MFLVDTNVLSEGRKIRSGRADRGVAEWFQSVAKAQTFISSITYYELEMGALLAETSDPALGSIVRRWIEESVWPSFRGRILPVDELVATEAARLSVPNPTPLADTLIAATALVNQMPVVTRNEHDFQRFDGLAIINPFSA